MKSIPSLITAVEALLPQTQCERCGFKGCRPYAEHVVRDKGDVNLCHPGGQITADAIATLTKRPVQAVEAPPEPQKVAFIREPDCIGCTKCIQVCPVDAIVGTSKQMHTVIESECTGCELCLPACPVDCIDLTTLGQAQPTWIVEQGEASKVQAEYAKQRFIARKERLNKEKRDKKKSLDSKTKLDIQAELAKIKARANNKPIEKNHEC